MEPMDDVGIVISARDPSSKLESKIRIQNTELSTGVNNCNGKNISLGDLSLVSGGVSREVAKV